MIFAGLGGWVIYTSYLRGIGEAGLAVTALTWSRCVGASALLFAVSSALLVRMFYPQVSLLVIIPFWLMFVLALDPGYRTAKAKGYPTEKAENDKVDSA